MIWSILFGVTVAVFAVFGFACAVQMILEACFPCRQLMVTVEIKTPKDADLLEMLLHEAQSAFFGKRSGRVGVLMSESLFENGEIPIDVLKILKKYGADCYLVEEQAFVS